MDERPLSKFEFDTMFRSLGQVAAEICVIL